jgi:hypothetical protein
MYFAPFYERFPEMAKCETRSVTVRGNPDLPDGEYGLIEAFCNRPNCDCCRVMFYILRPHERNPLAVIAYGWESDAFYARWYGQNDPRVIQEMQGPNLNFGSPQSSLAPVLLRLVEQILQDEDYVARVKRHYRLFKDAVNADAGKKRTGKDNKRLSRKRKKRR